MPQFQSLWHCVNCIQNGLLLKRLVYLASSCLSMFLACQKHGSLLMALHQAHHASLTIPGQGHQGHTRLSQPCMPPIINWSGLIRCSAIIPHSMRDEQSQSCQCSADCLVRCYAYPPLCIQLWATLIRLAQPSHYQGVLLLSAAYHSLPSSRAMRL